MMEFDFPGQEKMLRSLIETGIRKAADDIFIRPLPDMVAAYTSSSGVLGFASKLVAPWENPKTLKIADVRADRFLRAEESKYFSFAMHESLMRAANMGVQKLSGINQAAIDALFRQSMGLSTQLEIVRTVEVASNIKGEIFISRLLSEKLNENSGVAQQTCFEIMSFSEFFVRPQNYLALRVHDVKANQRIPRRSKTACKLLLNGEELKFNEMSLAQGLVCAINAMDVLIRNPYGRDVFTNQVLVSL